MPFDYSIKGWPATVVIDAATYDLDSCDLDDSGLVYAVAGVKNPHITIHEVNKTGPGDWHRRGGDFHIRVSGSKLYEYNKDGPNDFVFATGKKKGDKATGAGSADQSALANAMAITFRTAIKASMGL